METPKLRVELGPAIDRYLEATPNVLRSLYKLYSGVYLCRKCDVFTKDPEQHLHGETAE